MIRRQVKALTLAVALAACADTTRGPGIGDLQIIVQFGEENYCGLGVSPAIGVGGVPTATAQYRVGITMVDAVFGTHWEEVIPATDQVIPQGAARTYRGPCPGQYQRLRYRFEVAALDGAGRELARGSTTELIVPLSEAVAMRRRGQAPTGRFGPFPVARERIPPIIPRAPTDPAFGDDRP